MRHTNVLKGLLTLLLMTFVSFPCNAQFKKLLDKAKDVTKKVVVDKKADQKPSEEEVQVQVSPEPEQVQPEQDDKKWTPSPEAIAADPQATNETVDNGWTKSIREIHASYEHLDKDLFPYQPYYKYKAFYRMHERDNDLLLMDRFHIGLKSILGTPDLEKYAMPIETVIMADGTEACVPIDEAWRNAYTAVYMAEPSSTAAFKSFSWVIPFHSYLIGQLSYPMQNKEKGIIDAEKGYMLPWIDLFDKRWQREEIALDLARTETNLKEIVAVADSWFSSCDQVKDSYEKYWFYTMGACIYMYVIERHKDYNPNDAAIRKLSMDFERLKSQKTAMHQAVIADYAPAKPLPTGVQVSAEIKTKGTAAARSFAGAAVQKVIFLRSDWETFKEQKWPYRITGYRIPIVIVTKENGKLMMQNCDLQKSPEGSKWYVSAGMSGGKSPVLEQ